MTRPTSLFIINWWWGSSNAGDLGNAGYLLLTLHPGPLYRWVVEPDMVQSMDQIELFDI